MKIDTSIISSVEYRNAANSDVATVLLTRYDGTKTVVGRIEARQEIGGGTLFYAYDSFSRQAYPPANDVETLKQSYELDAWHILTVVEQLDKAKELGEENERSRQQHLRKTRSSKSKNESRTK